MGVISEGEKGEGVPVHLVNSGCGSEVSVCGCVAPLEQRAQPCSPSRGPGCRPGGVPCGQGESWRQGKSGQLSLLAKKVLGAGRVAQEQSKDTSANDAFSASKVVGDAERISEALAGTKSSWAGRRSGRARL